MTTRRAGNAVGDSKHEAHSDKNPAAEAGMSRDVINVGLNIFKNGIKDYSDTEKDALEWLWGYAFEELNGCKSALVEALGYDWTVIHKIFSGRYEASLDNFLEAINRLKRQAASGRTRLVETMVTKRIVEALDCARDTGDMVAVTGPTGRSKTFTAKHWARDYNHGRAKYVRVPSGCTRRTLVQHLCRSCGIGVNGKKTADLESRIFKAFDFRNTVIIDEAGHLLPRSGAATSALEYLRDLNDICKCGIALIFTNVYLDEIKNGRLAHYFEQFIGRIEFEVRIPDEVARSEVYSVVSAFHPSPNNKLLGLALKIARNRDGKLRSLFKDLQRAKEWAADHGRQLRYEDLKLASDWRLSGGVWPDDEA